jgi:hypothetical protein
MDLYKFIEPLGIITYTALFFTVINRLLKWKLKYHKMLGISTLILATLHALIVILAH